MIIVDFFHSVNLKNLQCMSNFCRVPNRVWDKEWSNLTFLLCKPKKKCTMYVKFSWAACLIEYKTENDQSELFHSANQKSVRRCSLSHFCCVPNRVWDKEWSHLTIFTFKPEKCTMFVMCLLCAEKSTR